jgi:dTDP-4-amino-4,6-dideoxygalactose transaminase
MILTANPHEQYISHKEEIDAAIQKVLSSGWYILGNEVSSFEQEFAEFADSAFGVGVASGTDAVFLALKAIDIKPGDEVITVSHTATATVTAIVAAGAVPVFVDIDSKTYSLDPDLLEKNITDKTKAIIPVHIYGHPAKLDRILEIAKKHSLKVIEDCCQAHGAQFQKKAVGSHGVMGCFSFYPTKNLGGVGDGGMVVTSDPDLDEKLRLLRLYGWKERYSSETFGYNSRLDEIQAAILRVKLKTLNDDNDARRRIAGLYSASLKDVGDLILPTEAEYAKHVYHLYVIQTSKRDALMGYLKTNGVGSGIHYPVPVHEQKAFAKLSSGSINLTNTDFAKDRILSLPLYPELSKESVKKVIDSIKRFYTEKS